MFAVLFTSIIEFMMFVGSLVIVYQVFLSDWLENIKSMRLATKEKSNSAEKLAKIKLTSTDIKDIENFVNQNAQFISNDTINQLASHLSGLHAQETLDQYDQELRNQIIAADKESKVGKVTITPLADALALEPDSDTETISIQDRPHRHNLI